MKTEREIEQRHYGFTWGCAFAVGVAGFATDAARWVDPEGAARTARAVAEWPPHRILLMLLVYFAGSAFAWHRGRR